MVMSGNSSNNNSKVEEDCPDFFAGRKREERREPPSSSLVLCRKVFLTILLVVVCGFGCIFLSLGASERGLFLPALEQRARDVWKEATKPITTGTDARVGIERMSKNDGENNAKAKRGYQISLGRKLLKNHDPAGAEALCAQHEHQDSDIDNYIEALICLGESRLALHNNAWSSGLMEHQSRQVMGKLFLARDNFQKAVQIEMGSDSVPIFPEARLGLGLSLFLIATRGSGKNIEVTMAVDGEMVEPGRRGKQQERVDEILFDALLHLNAAASMTSPTLIDPHDPHDRIEDWKQVHIAAMYNAALVHLALGDSSSATPIFQILTNLAANDEKKKEKDHHDREGKLLEDIDTRSQVIIIPQINLGATMVRGGGGSMNREAIAILNQTSTEYCQKVKRYTYQNDIDKTKTQKLCSMVDNNLAVAREIVGNQLKHDQMTAYDSAQLFEKDLGVVSGFVSMNRKLSNPGRQSLDDNSQSASTNGVVMENVPLSVGGYTYNRSPTTASSIDEALLVLEEAAHKEAKGGRLWIPLSRAKLQSGDRVGAVKAAARALEVVNTMEDIEAATNVIDAAMAQNGKRSQLNSAADGRSLEYVKDSSTIHDASQKGDVRTLRLEQEMLSLKLQLLQNSLVSNSDFGIPQNQQHRASHHPRQETVQAEKTSINENMVYTTRGQEHDVEKRIGNSFVGEENGIGGIVHGGQHEERVELTTAVVQEAMNQDQRATEITVQTTEIKKGENEKQEVDYVEEMDTRVLDEASTSDDHVKDDLVDDSHTDITASMSVEMESQLAKDEPSELIQKKAEIVSTPSGQNDVSRDKVANVDGDAKDSSSVTTNDEELPLAGDSTLSGELVNDEQELVDPSHQSGPSQTENAVTEAETTEEVDTTTAEEEEEEKTITLPELYSPKVVEVGEIPAASLSYMKMADAYLQKENFKLASKQFLKVLKKAPYHIPAILGYATSLERFVKPKQLGDVVLAYVNVTQQALAQDNERLAHATFQRAITISRNMEEDRSSILRQLAAVSFTNKLATDVQYELGMEKLKASSADKVNQDEAASCFRMANAYMAKESDDGNGFHPQSLVQLGKIALDVQGKADKALSLIQQALAADLGDMVVEALVCSARAKEAQNDRNGAIEDYKKAIAPEFLPTDASAIAYYNLGLATVSENRESAEKYIEMALKLGKDLTVEAVEILGEHHMAVVKSNHRTEWKRYQESLATPQRGGIMNGPAVVSNESIFSDKNGDDELGSTNGDTLSMLEQGAASYDGSIPMGEDGDTISIGSKHPSRVKANT